MCLRVCVCVRARARARVCVCVYVCVFADGTDGTDWPVIGEDARTLYQLLFYSQGPVDGYLLGKHLLHITFLVFIATAILMCNIPCSEADGKR